VELRPVKVRWRKEVRKWIRHRILDRKKPKDVKVLCLPTGKGLEITQIYDRLGIPRQNIWAVERKRQEFKLLSRNFPDVNLYHGDVLDFLNQTNETFDILSLDFQGHLTEKHVYTFDRIFRNKLIGKRGLIIYTFMRGREREDIYAIMNVPITVEITRDAYTKLVYGKPIRISVGHTKSELYSTDNNVSISTHPPNYDELIKNRVGIDMTIHDIAMNVFFDKAEYLLKLQETATKKGEEYEINPENLLQNLEILMAKLKEHVDKIMYNPTYRENIYYAPWLQGYLYKSGGKVIMKFSIGLFEPIEEYLKVVPERYWELNLFGKVFTFPANPVVWIPEPIPKAEIIKLIKQGEL
jgi:hypothetical protein